MAADIEKMMANATTIISHNPTYEMGAGHGFNNLALPHYDCSGFVLTCINMAGVPYGGASYTGDMPGCLEAAGWTKFSFASLGLSGLKRGDVLVWNKSGTTGANADGHTEFCYTNGGGSFIGARGGSISITGGYTTCHGELWNYVLRWKDNVVPKTWTDGSVFTGTSGSWSSTINTGAGSNFA